jgi:hypothetical protein
VSEIIWRLDTDDAAHLARVLGEVVEAEFVDEDDLADVNRYVSELLGLVKQQRDYDATIQPGLVGLA